MANRLLRVNELLKREISSVIEKDFDFTNVLITINSVEVTPDLRHAQVYVGMLGGTANEQRNAREKLENGRVLIQGRIAKRVVLKNTPRLKFHIDNSVERGVELVNLIQTIDDLPTADPEVPEAE